MSQSPILIECAPRSIQYAVMKRSMPAKLRFAWNGMFLPRLVKAGAWDLRTLPVDEHPTVILMDGLCRNEFRPDRCRPLLAAYYARRGLSVKESEEKAERKVTGYAQEYCQVAESMLAHGYRVGVAKDEAGVGIGRDGTFLKVSGGQHRFALARALGLNRMVVHVRFVHVRWFRHWGRVFRDNAHATIVTAVSGDRALVERFPMMER